ncbi:methylmalonyl Co-A mutase-associated GTPase MeaB [Bacillaceae bacterium Marseille-Q3522]|nr:methylmalonyl Co-A mutase-associated GTPase MeaB [Bacillaceae bacterium Marseille-Q3522]
MKGEFRKKYSVEDFVEGILNGERTIIAKAITLVESNSVSHNELAQNLINKLVPYTGKSIRIGISGAPGSGKSTLIESLGMMLCKKNHRVAVLAIDPTSKISKGSILGDKIRMENLSRNPHAFVRPSPSCGTLGGVTRKSRETLFICEAAGFDVIIVETVGVGQSEIAVRSMVDFFLVVILPGAGDEIQAMKKGILEFADGIVINKSDGKNKQIALDMKEDYNRLLLSSTKGWKTKAYNVSALTGEGVYQIWDTVMKFKEVTESNKVFEKRRKEQMVDWLHSIINDQLKYRFYKNKKIKTFLPKIEKLVIEGKMTSTFAANYLIDLYNARQ